MEARVGFWSGFTNLLHGLANSPEYQKKHAERMAIAEAAAAERFRRQEADRQKSRQKLLGHIAQRAALKASSVQKGRDLQYKDEGCKVKVKSGYDRDHGAIVTDVIVIDRNSTTEHYHLVIHEVTGAVLFEGWRPNR